jgi:glutaminase
MLMMFWIYFSSMFNRNECQELANSFFSFANEGETKDGNKILTKSQVKRLNASCKLVLYDESENLLIK